MFSEKFIQKITTEYIDELKAMGRKFNPIKVKVKTRKSITNFGKAMHTCIRYGYDTIEINQYIVTENELRNTILHELAHLDLYARGHGHGYRWKQVAALYGRKYNTKITTKSKKEIKVPGQVIVKVAWSDEFYKYNPNWKYGNTYEKVYSSTAYAKNFVKKYERMGFIKNYQIVPA